MNWKDEAKKELRIYAALRESVGILPERLAWIQAQKTSLRSSSAGTTPVQGGANRYEDRLLDLIVQEDRLKLTLDADRIRLNLIERGLAALSEQDRRILLTFASHRSGEAVDLLAEELCLEQAQIYRLYSGALYRFTIAEYGIPEY